VLAIAVAFILPLTSNTTSLQKMLAERFRLAVHLIVDHVEKAISK
jgi:hypothetical protein